MRLKELAVNRLIEGDDFKHYCFRGNIPVFNDIGSEYNSESIKGEYFRFTNKIRFSLKIDGQEIPFATMTWPKREVFSDNKYEVRVEILPCMIPKALEGLAIYAQEHPVISGKNFSKKETKSYMQEIQFVQMELNKLLKSTLLERKIE